MVSNKMSWEEANNIIEIDKKKRKRNKYNAVRTKVDGITFDSKLEAKHYCELKVLERAGKISDLQLQPEFILQEPFEVAGQKFRAIKYKADFKFLDHESGRYKVVDSKGVRRQSFIDKKKAFLKLYGDKYAFEEWSH